VARLLRQLDWSFKEAAPSRDIHSIHPYPAKFIPELPRQLIDRLSEPGDLVLDPFSGAGTAAVEALLADRHFLGIDANPIGNAAARAKTANLDAGDLSALRQVEKEMMALNSDQLRSATPSWLPEIPNVDKWYDDDVFRALGVARDRVLTIAAPNAQATALVAFVQAAAKLSFQESETRYVSKPREIDVVEVSRAVLTELRRVRRLAEDLTQTDAPAPCFVDGDARDPASFPLQSDSVGLVVTSPPYPNTFDYHLYHRFRLFWLGEDPKHLRQVEIGSHLKNQTVRDPIEAYLNDLRAVLTNCLSALQPGRYATFVVGDGLFKGEVFGTAEALSDLAREVGYDHIATLDRLLPLNRRSVTKPGRRLTTEQIVFLRKPASPISAVALPPNYTLFEYERALQRRELEALGGSPRSRTDDGIAVSASRNLDLAAFTHAVQQGNGIKRPTLQCRLEGADRSDPPSRRKNSTYAGHGVHRYKGKFYPQLAKSLLNLCGLERGKSLVADPFGGSGTVAAEAQVSGLDAVSFDCNPVAVAVARAKTAIAGPEAARLPPALETVREAVEAAPAWQERALTQFGDEVEELQSWFPSPVLHKLDWLLETIRTETKGDATNVLEVLVSDLIREVSQQEPRDLRIRRRKTPLEDAPVLSLFAERAAALEERVHAFVEAGGPAVSGGVKAKILQADSGDPRSFDELSGRQIDAVVSSPPYAAALPYIDTDRLSLLSVFGYSRSARRDLEQMMIGSREIGKREQDELEADLTGCTMLPASTILFLSAFAKAVRGDESAGFRRRQSPAVLFRYFRAMQKVFANLAANCAPSAPCFLVLGDSRSTIGSKTWTIPTVDEVAAIAEQAGFALVDRLPITVTREDLLNARHAITRNEILELRLR
jgi:DNA modification methylase